MFKIISKEKLAQTQRQIELLTTAATVKEKEMQALRDRVVALEDAHEKQTGIKVRVDNATVLAKFTKPEMCVLQGALYAYARNTSNMTDTRFAMDLYEKMVPMIAGMRE